MKVLKQGKPWSIKSMCTGAGNNDTGCGATLEVEEVDLYITTAHHRDESETFVTFRCCECKAETDIGKGKIPSALLDRLPTKTADRREKERTGRYDD